jgi:hypothetical protein
VEHVTCDYFDVHSDAISGEGDIIATISIAICRCASIESKDAVKRSLNPTRRGLDVTRRLDMVNNKERLHCKGCRVHDRAYWFEAKTVVK